MDSEAGKAVWSRLPPAHFFPSGKLTHLPQSAHTVGFLDPLLHRNCLLCSPAWILETQLLLYSL